MELRAGGAGAQRIATALNEDGGNPRTGRDWHPSTVADILRRLEGHAG